MKRSGKTDLLGKGVKDQGVVDNLLGVFDDVRKAIAGMFAAQDEKAVEAGKEEALGKMKPKL